MSGVLTKARQFKACLHPARVGNLDRIAGLIAIREVRQTRLDVCEELGIVPTV